MIAQLMPLDGGKAIDVHRDFVLVGRHSRCDLRIRHKTISKVHCVLVKTDGLLFLRDLGSTNGCQVNGRRVTRAALLPNDVLSLANFRFRVHLGPGTDDEQAERRERTELIVEPGGRISQRDASHLPRPHRSRRLKHLLESSIGDLPSSSP